jgi:tetratricopeptide (TPR) repeat protein
LSDQAGRQPDSGVYAIFEKGKALFHAGRFRQSARYWEEYLLHDAESVVGYYYLSICKARQRNGVEALRLAERGLEIDPSSEWGYLAKAVALCGLGRSSEALATTEKALERAPERLQIIAFSGYLQAYFGSPQTAKERAELGLRIDPEDVLCHLALARLMTRRGDNPAAQEHIKERLSTNPDSALLIEHLAWSTLPCDRKIAGELFETALELNPDSRSARQGLLLGERVPHLGILWNLPQGWLKCAGPLVVAYFLSFYPTAYILPILFTTIWLNRAYSNLILSMGRYKRLLTKEERIEGPLTLGTFLTGLGLWRYLDPACGLLVCLLSFAIEQSFDSNLRSVTVAKQIPLLLGSYFTAWFWNPWYWAVGYAISWFLGKRT